MLTVQSKRRKTKQQIVAEKLHAQEEEVQIQQKLASIEALEAQLEEAKADALNNKGAYVQLTGLISKGHVVQDQEGNCFAKNDQPDEHGNPDDMGN